MAGGEARFRAKHGDAAGKIDSDTAIPASVKQNAWQEIELAGDAVEIGSFAQKVFNRLQFQGPLVSLGPAECVGTAQRRTSLEESFARQKPPRLPALTLLESRMYLSEVEREADPVTALRIFHCHFQHLRLRSIRRGRKKARLFAFRNAVSPSDPMSPHPLTGLFKQLSIPNLDAVDCTMLGFKPATDDLVHQPTCFDANMWNLGDFIPGGITAGGVQEVVVTPPRVQSVTHAPRRTA